MLSGCTPKPPDVPACEHLSARIYKDPVSGHEMLSPSPTCFKAIEEPECGHCVYIVSGKEAFYGEKPGHFLNGKPWSLVRASAVMLPAKESYAPLSAYIIDSCDKMGCSNQVDQYRVKLGSLGGVSAPQ